MTTELDRSPGITAQLVGGLGNQLFIYACARAVATRLSCSTYFDVSLLKQPMPDETPRELALEWLLEPQQLMPTIARTSGSRIRGALARRLRLSSLSTTFRESGFTYDPAIDEVRVGARIEGYFQSWRYFDAMAAELRRDLLAKAPHSSWSATELERLNAFGPWTAVHVRRGDYTSAANADHHGLLGMDYYKDAIEEAHRNNPNTPIVVFSDDPSVAQELLGPADAPMYFVNPPSDAHAMESMVLMSHASAIVLANSSFSWWGAWLADPHRTPAFAPSPWFKSSRMPDADIYHPKWTRVNSHLKRQTN